MRKIILVLAISALLIGCEHQQNTENGLHWMEVVDNGLGTRTQYVILRHRQTGVCYLIRPGTAAVPLLTAEGKPYIIEGLNDDS